MVAVSKSNFSRTGRGSLTRRRTRNSFFGELKEPPRVLVEPQQSGGVTHSAGVFIGTNVTWWCCLHDLSIDVHRWNGSVVTCLACVQCRGCPACNPHHITEMSFMLGKWETKDGRTLYPFEMDNQHLLNSIAKLKRDREHFKDAWETWVEILEDEAAQRRLL